MNVRSGSRETRRPYYYHPSSRATRRGRPPSAVSLSLSLKIISVHHGFELASFELELSKVSEGKVLFMGP